MKKRWYLYSIALLSAVVFYLFFDFVEGIKDYKALNSQKAQAIVVLTGGFGRAEEGLRLLRKDGSALILSGVHEDADVDSIFFPDKITDLERKNIILEKKSTSTYENAIEVRKIVKEKGLKSIVLITSGYHIIRADYIFGKTVPPEVKVIPYGISTPNFDEDRWWSGKGFAIILIEFFKYYLYMIGFNIGIVDV